MNNRFSFTWLSSAVLTGRFPNSATKAIARASKMAYLSALIQHDAKRIDKFKIRFN